MLRIPTILLSLVIPSVCGSGFGAHAENVPKSIACKLFDESGFTAIDQESRDANNLMLEGIYKRRDAALAEYAKKVEAVLSADGMDVKLYDVNDALYGDDKELLLDLPGCGI